MTEDAPESDEARSGSDPGVEGGAASAAGAATTGGAAADAVDAAPTAAFEAGQGRYGDDAGGQTADPATGAEGGTAEPGDAAEVMVTMDEDANEEGQGDRTAVL